jgi:hypothetical protein
MGASPQRSSCCGAAGARWRASLGGEIKHVPEFAESIKEALREMQRAAPPMKAQKAKPSPRIYTRSTSSYIV